ncbi:hypothetical protein BH10PAT3_BH10PAT3_3060 [soil metagenome]
MRKLSRVLLIVFLLLLFGNDHAAAASKVPDITITPFLQEVRFNASEGTKKFDISLANGSKKAQDFNLSVVDFGSLDDSGGVVFSGSKASDLVKKYGLANWLQLSSPKIRIEAGQTSIIQATIIDDVSLSPGGHYAAIVASIVGDESPVGAQVSVNQKISSLILATKTGGEKYDMKLSKIEANASLFSLPKSVILHFYNPGNVHVVPRGTVKVLSPSGQLISQGVINQESGYVLPETTRQMTVDIRSIGPVGWQTGSYRVRVDYRYDGIDKYARKEQRLTFVNLFSFIALGLLLSLVILVIIKLKNSPKTGAYIAKCLRKLRTFKHGILQKRR